MPNCYVKGVFMPKPQLTQLQWNEVVCLRFMLPSCKERCCNQNVCHVSRFLNALPIWEMRRMLSVTGDATVFKHIKCHKNAIKRTRPPELRSRLSAWEVLADLDAAAMKWRQLSASTEVRKNLGSDRNPGVFSPFLSASVPDHAGWPRGLCKIAVYTHWGLRDVHCAAVGYLQCLLLFLMELWGGKIDK